LFAVLPPFSTYASEYSKLSLSMRQSIADSLHFLAGSHRGAQSRGEPNPLLPRAHAERERLEEDEEEEEEDGEGGHFQIFGGASDEEEEGEDEEDL
jgi:hypothetical protein